jgi:hypothetical protein
LAASGAPSARWCRKCPAPLRTPGIRPARLRTPVLAGCSRCVAAGRDTCMNKGFRDAALSARVSRRRRVISRDGTRQRDKIVETGRRGPTASYRYLAGRPVRAAGWPRRLGHIGHVAGRPSRQKAAPRSGDWPAPTPHDRRATSSWNTKWTRSASWPRAFSKSSAQRVGSALAAFLEVLVQQSGADVAVGGSVSAWNDRLSLIAAGRSLMENAGE